MSDLISYILSKVEHPFPEQEADPFPALHDWTLFATWIYATGWPYKEPVSVEEDKIRNIK